MSLASLKRLKENHEAEASSPVTGASEERGGSEGRRH